MILSAALYIKHHPHANLAVPHGSLLARQSSVGCKVAVLDHHRRTVSGLVTYQPAAFFPRSNRRWGGDDKYILQLKPGDQVRRCPWMQQPPFICHEVPMICSCLPRAGPGLQKRGKPTSQPGHVPDPQHFLVISELPTGVSVKLQERLAADLHSCDLIIAFCGVRPVHASF